MKQLIYICLYRFVNFVQESNFTENEVWKNIKNLQFERKKRTPIESQKDCKSIKCKIEKLSLFVQMKNISDDVNEDYSKSSMKSSYKMFLTLIEPPYFERLYSETIYGPQSRLIMLASKIVNKSPNYFQLKAKKIFSKMTSLIFKKYHFEKEIENNFLTLKGKDNQKQKSF